MIDNDGNILNHITYDSFGQITNQTNPETYFRFGYTGREFDQESGQYYYRARYFDPNIGRFISEDPIGFDGGDSNLFRYVGNSSINYIDPTGNFSVSQVFNDVLTSDITYNLVNGADQFVAGFSDVTTFGATTKIRGAAYGETATRNHQGGLFTTGQVAGGVTSFAVGAGAPSSLRGATLAQRFAQGHTVIGAGVGGYQSTRNIIEGCATWWDALSFAPVAGFGAGKLAPRLRGLGGKAGNTLDDVPNSNIGIVDELSPGNSKGGISNAPNDFVPGVDAANPVIGKLDDIDNPANFKPGETSLNVGGENYSWDRNRELLQSFIDEGKPIRDISPTKGGGILDRERSLLIENGWRFNPSNGYWSSTRS